MRVSDNVMTLLYRKKKLIFNFPLETLQEHLINCVLYYLQLYQFFVLTCLVMANRHIIQKECIIIYFGME